MGGFTDFTSGVSSILDIAGPFIQNDWNKRAAQRSMDFSERMSSSAYQRSAADMKAAGLNPMLAYMQGGASSPSGSAIPSNVDFGDIGHSARDLSRMKLESKENVSRVGMQEAQTRAADAVAEAHRADARLKEADLFPKAKFNEFLEENPHYLKTQKIMELIGLGATSARNIGLGIGGIKGFGNLFGGRDNSDVSKSRSSGDVKWFPTK